MLIFGLYATYDRIAKTTGSPFLASNDDAAKAQLVRVIKQIKERNEDFVEDTLTVLNLGYYACTITENKSARGDIVGFGKNIYMNNEIYDVFYRFQGMKERKELLNDEEMLKRIKEEINGN